MTMNLYNEDGLVDQLCSNAGWGELHAGLEKAMHLNGYPLLMEFLAKGETEDPQGLRKEVKLLLTHKDQFHKSVIGTLENLMTLLAKANECAIVGD